MMTRKTILIVDDDEHLVQLLALRCNRIGMEVFTAYNALTAMNLLDQHPIDLLCLDVNMPTGNGLSVCEALLTDPSSVSYPIIILTGRKDPATIRKCHDLCVYYVEKCPDIWRRLEPLIQELTTIPQPRRPFPKGITGASRLAGARVRG